MSKGKYRMSEPELRSLDMLQSVAKGTPNVQVFMLTNECIRVRVQGESHRWYQIDSNFQGVSSELFQTPKSQSQWSVAVTAGRWQNDVISENQYSVSLCIHSKNPDLPIGDRIVSLVLALYNDIKTALQIPMLAQFLICTREMLKEIVIFQDMMIVTTAMMGEEDWDFPGPQDDEDIGMNENQEMDMYGAFERDELQVSTDEMLHRQQVWEEEMRGLELAQQEQEAATEKKETEQQELINFWELMSDKLNDS
tara:strand:+ start:2073 stop:2828 length:756 start_codon:yes stop_codon:yes gene_type:complete